MIRYKAGYKYVATGIHAQVLDFPAAITCAADLDAARRLLAVALADVAEAAIEAGEPLPPPVPSASDPEVDIEDPIYLPRVASSEVRAVVAGTVSLSDWT